MPANLKDARATHAHCLRRARSAGCQDGSDWSVSTSCSGDIRRIERGRSFRNIVSQVSPNNEEVDLSAQPLSILLRRDVGAGSWPSSCPRVQDTAVVSSEDLLECGLVLLLSTGRGSAIACNGTFRGDRHIEITSQHTAITMWYTAEPLVSELPHTPPLLHQGLTLVALQGLLMWVPRKLIDNKDVQWDFKQESHVKYPTWQASYGSNVSRWYKSHSNHTKDP